LSPGAHQTLQNYFNKVIGCDSSNSACLSALPVDTIVNAAYNLTQVAVTLDASAGLGQPIRPVHDGVLLTHTMDSTAPFPKVSKPLLLSTVKNEAGLTIYGSFDTPVATAEYRQVVAASLGKPRSDTVMNAPYYKVHVLADGTTDARSQLETMGTDQIWKCSTWTFAKTWVANGGSAYVGLYTTGASYPGNSDVPFCTQNGVVCHQDDIEIVVRCSSYPCSTRILTFCSSERS
jgi:carboxylesterase type B